MDVLVVDDNAGSAATFATLIRRATQLEASSTDDPQMALSIVEAEPIGVVVLDERMPEMSGTDLFLKIHAIDAEIRAIMLTGEANDEEIGLALNRGFNAFLKKRDVQELPSMVLAQFVDFQANRAIASHRGSQNITSRLFIPPSRLGRLRRHTLTVTVVSESTLAAHIAPDEAWHTVEQLVAGETATTVNEVTHRERVIIEQGETEALGGQLTVPGAHAATAAIKGELERSITRQGMSETSLRRQVSRTLTMPHEAQDRDAPQLRSRNRQEAPSFTKRRITIRLECSCCGQAGYTSLVAWVHDGGFLTREIDHYSDGKERIVNTARII
jgi:CheY-like chemotaxis protein